VDCLPPREVRAHALAVGPPAPARARLTWRAAAAACRPIRHRKQPCVGLSPSSPFCARLPPFDQQPLRLLRRVGRNPRLFEGQSPPSCIVHWLVKHTKAWTPWLAALLLKSFLIACLDNDGSFQDHICAGGAPACMPHEQNVRNPAASGTRFKRAMHHPPTHAALAPCAQGLNPPCCPPTTPDCGACRLGRAKLPGHAAGITCWPCYCVNKRSAVWRQALPATSPQSRCNIKRFSQPFGANSEPGAVATGRHAAAPC
jgi:hypothetical protein